MMTEKKDIIEERYNKVLGRIAAAARSCGRKPESVRLVVVTKSQPTEIVQAAIDAGARILGENYPEEAVEKINTLQVQNSVEWHMIGHIQSRKAGLVIADFALLHSLDSYKLAAKLNRLAHEAGKRLRVLLEFNVGGEESKFGWPAWDEKNWHSLVPGVTELFRLENLEIKGLMVMPPIFADPELSRPFFKKARKLMVFFAENIPVIEWNELSMGTSGDFEVAVQEGATLVRVGQSIVGPRQYSNRGKP
ncbi:MAG: YggS family pyridoxal phosphate-dependent enzyme [Anaerolineales bacterium]|nr:YggS family pyridoxal phosphate-dependent enzyme [Anaerolineales bacterium]